MFDIRTCYTYAYSAGTEADFAQSLTGDAASTNLIDHGAANINLGGGKKSPYILIKALAAFNTLTSLEILLETDTDSGFATAKKQVQKWEFALASLTAGALLVCQALPAMKSQRYSRLTFNVVGSNPSTGSIIAALVDGPEAAAAELDQVSL